MHPEVSYFFIGNIIRTFFKIVNLEKAFTLSCSNKRATWTLSCVSFYNRLCGKETEHSMSALFHELNDRA